MWRGISLANKCLLLFGGAVVLIVLLALSVPWLRMNALVDEGQMELSRSMVDTWVRLDAERGPAAEGPAQTPEGVVHAGIRALQLTVEEAEERAASSRFMSRVLRAFRADPERGISRPPHGPRRGGSTGTPGPSGTRGRRRRSRG